MILDSEYIKTLKPASQTRLINRFRTLEQECIDAFQGYYTYHNAVYRGMAVKTTITCPFHGDYEQSLDQHLKAGYGCRLCADENNRKTILKEQFIEDSIAVHGDKYDYTLVEDIKKSRQKIKIICRAHGVFEATHYRHLVSKNGCRKCAQEYHDIDFRRRYFDTSTVLYYVKLTTVDGEVFYKIGITNRFDENGDVSKRFKSEKVEVETLYYEVYESGLLAYEKEQKLLNQYKQFAVPYNVIVLKNGGNSEVLSEDCWDFYKKENS